MSELPSRELRNDTAGVLRRVEAGEVLTVTVKGNCNALNWGVKIMYLPIFWGKFFTQYRQVPQ